MIWDDLRRIELALQKLLTGFDWNTSDYIFINYKLQMITYILHVKKKLKLIF